MIFDERPLIEKIKETIETIRQKTISQPEIGIILGTGLGGIAEYIDNEVVIPYEDLLHFPLSTVEFHNGMLIFGKKTGKKIVAMQGRFHYYEGYSMRQITYPVRVMKFLGVKTLIISNACGTVNPEFSKGNIMIIDDHINLMGDNPLIGPNDSRLGVRFPDMSEPYSKKLIKLAEEIALDNKIKLYKGVYAAMTGPSLETRAEYRFLRTIGADVVGMSTVPENIVARHCGMDVLGLSIITDECNPESLKQTSLEEIIQTASLAEPDLNTLIKKFISKL
jgi:purine-nucleoside phosphorylase